MAVEKVQYQATRLLKLLQHRSYLSESPYPSETFISEYKHLRGGS